MARQAAMDQDLLAAALVGYEAEITRINAAIAQIRARLGQQAAGGDGQPTPRRPMSAAARRRIAAAQRKRWAATRKAAARKAVAKAAS